jgi:enamine deaminase RidA (YjgF/YER057c/UK114 family)
MIEGFVVPELAPPPGYAHAARATGRIVFTAGAVPLDATGTLVGVGDLGAQTAQVVANLRAQLRSAGAGPEHVVKTTVYVVADRHDQLVDVWRAMGEEGFVGPPSTLVGVSLLGYPDQLVEIEAIAVIE